MWVRFGFYLGFMWFLLLGLNVLLVGFCGGFLWGPFFVLFGFYVGLIVGFHVGFLFFLFGFYWGYIWALFGLFGGGSNCFVLLGSILLLFVSDLGLYLDSMLVLFGVDFGFC